MFKKLILIIALNLFISIPVVNGASIETFTCLDIKQEIKRICTECSGSSRNSTVKVTDIQGDNPFTKSEYNCNELAPLQSSDPSTFLFDRINCRNYTQTVCTGEPETSKEIPKLVASNSEFFNVTDPNSGLLGNPNQGQSFQNAAEAQGPILGPILLIINFLTGIIATLAILALVIGSFFMISARGEESQITRGKDIIKNSLIALVIVLTSYTVIRTIQATVILILQ